MVAVASTRKHHGASAPVSLNEATRARPHVSLRAAGIASGTVAGLLTVDAMLHEQSRFDVWTIQTVQKFDAPGLETIVHAISTLTSSEGAIAMWALTLVILAVSRWWLAALAMFTLPIGGLVNNFVGEVVVGRTRPDAEVVTRTVPDIQAASFPSGHVMGAVMLYGFLFFVASRIQNRVLRFAVRGVSAGIIGTIGFIRVWEGAHWPTDVIGAYAFGGIFLVAIFAVYNKLEASVGHLPFIHAGEVAHDESSRHAHALTSTVIFREGEVAKVYNPGFLPRAIYWLSFQAAFPYERNERALNAAMGRRNLAAMLTEYWYGERRVARVTSVERSHGQFALVSEFVDGAASSDRADAKAFLIDLKARFESAGLPTWQIDPRQPRAIDNVLETANGYQIVDLESGLASPMASIKSWKRALRRGHVPLFDTVFYDITREYVAEESAAMRAQMGDAWMTELEGTIATAETETNAWYASEPRMWSVLAQPKSWKARIEARVAGGQDKAMGWLTTSVDAWEAEGRISDAEAVELRAQMDTPQFQAVIPHLGAHVVISILLRFPFGSIARAGWTTWALLAATVRLLVRRSDLQTWKQAWSIHNPLVIALGAIPGFGTFAYLAAGPVRSNRLLMRVTVDAVMFKMPWRLYERTGMRRIVVIGRAENTRRDEQAIPANIRTFEPAAHSTESGFGTSTVVPMPIAAFTLTSMAVPMMTNSTSTGGNISGTEGFQRGFGRADLTAWD